MSRIKENQIWVTKKNYGKRYGNQVIRIKQIKEQYVINYENIVGETYGNFTRDYFKKNWRLLKNV